MITQFNSFNIKNIPPFNT